ncbi:MAG: FdhD protein [Frankiaceae bacterium]|jgi:FdhD protein|nr:FdhD protein [Frankiaceae bacterium]
MTERRRVVRVDDGRIVERPDTLAVEEPLEIRVGGRAVSVTMRTPGHDLDLALGFLLTEGVVATPDDVVEAIACGENVVDVTTTDEAAARVVERRFYTSSSCGLCGKESIDAVRTRSPYDVASDGVRVDRAVLTSLPDKLRDAQRVFERTGGLHAAGLFTVAGELVCLREDVGRHNAVDKVVGWAVQQRRLPLTGCVLQVSGRASFELVQKAAVAGVPVLAAVSAPSSLAVALADETGMTLVGFLRGQSFNVYARPDRVAGAAP